MVDLYSVLGFKGAGTFYDVVLCVFAGFKLVGEGGLLLREPIHSLPIDIISPLINVNIDTSFALTPVM